MSGEELVLGIIAITMSCGVLIIGITKISDLIKNWMNRNNNSIPEEQFDWLAKAFIQYKKDTENRLQNLEAIIADDDAGTKTASSKSSKQVEAPKESIQIEDRETEQEQSGASSDNNLKNMLQE